MERIDEKDKKIIEMISKNPRITQKQLAEKLDISQPAISMRINKLRENGLLEMQVGMNPNKADLTLAKVDIKSKSVSFLNELAKCPYVIFASTSTGDYNIVLIMAGENYKTLEAIVNKHIRSFEDIVDIKFNIIMDHYGKIVVPFKTIERPDQLPSCAIKLLESSGCANCFYYKKGTCLGCPLLDDYRGKLLGVTESISVARKIKR